jgi:glycosyltransferase involved in cell wall biosynthesis
MLATFDDAITSPTTISPPVTVVDGISTSTIWGGALGASIGMLTGGIVGAGEITGACCGVMTDGAFAARGELTVGAGDLAGDAVAEAVVGNDFGNVAGTALDGNGAALLCGGTVTTTASEGVGVGEGVGDGADCCGVRCAQPEAAIVAATISALRLRGMVHLSASALTGSFVAMSNQQAMEARKPTLSVVVPLYNEEGNVAPLFERIEAVLSTLSGKPSYEIVVVDDGSGDATAERVRDEMHKREHVVLVRLSRNFGHQLAATAGIENAAGDAVILMDGDLQDPPELIEQFVARWREGYDVVYAVRRTRKGESAFKLLTARLFYRLVRRMTKIDIPVDTGDFRLMSRRVVEALRRSTERHRFLRGMVSWVGFRQIGVPYDRDVRYSGATKYPLAKMLRFAVDGITSFSDVPLRFASYLGFCSSVVAFVYAIYVIVSKIVNVHPLAYTPGWASTIVAVLFLGGVQLIGIGILGEYIGRIYDEVKGRPIYLISEIERS